MTTSLHKKTIVNWKLVEFFSDEGDFHLSGFRLSYVKGTETFYTQTFADQKNWVLWLSKLCLTNYLNTSFRVLEIIGEGVHSEVRKAVRIDTNETFAIKYVLKKSHAIDPCMKEIDLLRRLNHESIVKLYGVFDTAEYLAVVLEYAEGGSLYEYMQSHKRLEEDLARQFMINLLQAIAYLHNNKCVHRNLKLENILLMDRDNPLSFKVADFGLACDLSSEKLGTRCGSVGYIAPEIILKRPQSNKVDLFSAGVIMHMLLSGLAPFLGSTELLLLRANAECAIDLNSIYWAHISDIAKDLVSRLLSKEALSRPSAKEALNHPMLQKGLRLSGMPSLVDLSGSQIFHSRNLHAKKLRELDKHFKKPTVDTRLPNFSRDARDTSTSIVTKHHKSPLQSITHHLRRSSVNTRTDPNSPGECLTPLKVNTLRRTSAIFKHEESPLQNEDSWLDSPKKRLKYKPKQRVVQEEQLL
eukprot:CAMPEP_0204916976 /NCGR_PEP_ID=MMETSP1397-20131031/14678_1 /ASSEMBLY_ACC=CAM_ASM_000891 /TAXON_ID=49980 /ORGANISM="Climacostomum Climacostomum virens, Strain Stock W-24" /LENGTH=468 /DNA_ID=CAMNT_0052089685 /DNA_START=407 /DNA_END=1813 /DNA_ORIENTATION=+